MIANSPLSESDMLSLKTFFSDITLYDSDDNDVEIDPLTYISPEGDTCLHIAVIRKDFDIVKLLLDANLDVNAKDYMGCTPMYFAEAKGLKKIKNLLAQYGGYIEPCVS